MPITRIGQLTAEFRNTDDFQTFGNESFIISSTHAKTGTYAYKYNVTAPMGLGFTARDELRSSYWMRYNSVAGRCILFIFHVSSTTLSGSHYIMYNASTTDIEMYVAGTLVDSISAATIGFNVLDTWHQFASTIKAHATDGFFSLYFNGDRVLNYTGEIDVDIDAVYVSGYYNTSFSAWGLDTYVDDFYVDDTTGEDDASPSGRRFMLALPDGAGANAAWTPSTGSNYQNVDDTPHDGDSTYNYALTSGLKDTFNLQDVTLPALHALRAVIPTAMVKKTDAEYDGQLKLHSYDGSTYRSSDAISLQTSYKSKFVRWTIQNDATAWDQTDFNAYQFGYEST